MSFEQSLESIAQSLAIIATKMNTGAVAQAEFVSGEISTVSDVTAKAKPGRPKKTETAGTEENLKVLPGDPEGTRYWVHEVDGSVFAEKPGMPAPAEAGFKISSPAAYAKAKEDLAKKSGATGTQTTPPAANPASTTPVVSTASSNAASGSVELTFDMVLKKFTELSSDPRDGRGREAVMYAIEKHGKPHGVERLTLLQGKVDNTTLFNEAVNLLANGVPKAGGAADLF